MCYKKNIFIFTIGAIIAFLMILYISLVAYFYDPIQLFSEKYKNKYNTTDYNARFYSKRIIDNYDFDSVILGSSMMIRANQNEFKNTINLSFAASTWDGRAIILDYLFKNKSNIKNIITTYDGFYEHSLELNNIDFAYNNDKKNIFKHYFRSLISGKYLYCFLTLSHNEECIGENINFSVNKEKHEQYNLNVSYNENIENVIKEILKSDDYSRFSSKIDNARKNYFKYSYHKIASFINIIKQNQNTRFHIVIPPYPTFSLKNEGDNLFNIINHYRYGLNELMKYSNVVIYGFNLENFTDDLRNYFDDDLWHYKPWINSRINKAINEGTNIITKENMDEYFDKFIKKVENYDIKAYEEALKLDIRE